MDPQNTTSAEQAQMLMLRGAIAMMPQEQQDAIDGYAKTIRSMIATDPLAALALGLVGSELAAGVEVKA
ncbi:TPA: hypothetical protein U2Q01_001834 [Burkholderia multivorans]|uniref:hypothetical protein n=1 Tax=Burkholderia cepacia complex TaxID=87882 RepID=UPI001AA049D6|nr:MULTISPECIES: hypothetical protein [Burkholderia cepacia complex]MBR8021228.1 hypothetical protein [Burkholderia multivorans]MBU9489950.1 hypothetical protein [Burkholderia multivorans]MCO8643213.1 hypothetical protein [Burkholderia multivorans]QTD88318.1 hypothetical protein J4G50_10795 [Burkholderia anthina]HEF4732722.1 hypothetical protein [Burkholderia multivorans]